MRAPQPVANRVALASTVLAGVLYLTTGPAAIGWFDAPELAAAGQQLGVAHAPGEPFYLLLLRLAQLLPVGDLAARAAWLSCAAAALLVGALVLLARELFPERCASLPGLAAVGLFAAPCGPLWTQGVVIELYGLQALIAVAMLLVLARSEGRAGPLALAGLLAGLGLAVNPLLTILAMPAVAVIALGSTPRPRLRALAWTVPFAALGASTLLYVPLRAAAEPGVWYGGLLDTPSSVLEFVTGRSYARSFERPTAAALAANVVEHARLVVHWIGIPAAALAAVGLVSVGRRPVALTALAAFGLAAWASTASRPVLETFTPDVAGYLLPSCLVCALLAAAGLGRLAGRWPVPAWLALIAAVAVTAVAGAAKVDRHRGTEPGAVARTLLAAAPAGGILLCGSDSTSLPLLYAVTAERRRPDVLASGIYGLHGPRLRALAAARPHVIVTPLAAADGLVPEERLRALATPNLARGVVGTPLLWPPELLPGLEPAGLAMAAGRAGDTAAAETDRRLERELLTPLWSAPRLTRDRQLRRLLGSTAGAQAHVLLRQRRVDEARVRLQVASSRHPDPWAMVHLQRAGVEEGSLAPPALWPAGSAAAFGWEALARGDAAAAAPLLELAVSERPADADLWEDLATARFFARDLAGASHAWNEALRLRPGSPGALAGRERLYAAGIP